MNLLLVCGVLLTIWMTFVTSQEKSDCCQFCLKKPPPIFIRPKPFSCKNIVTARNNEISVLKSALDAQRIVIRVVPPRIKKPITQKTFRNTRDRLIKILGKKTPFAKNKGIKRPSNFKCPNKNNVARAIRNLPVGSTLTFIAKRKSLEPLNPNTKRACAECQYQVTLPGNYSPDKHIHVVCPASQQNCFEALGICANNEVVMTILKKPAGRFNILKASRSSAVRITFNKGCSCQMRSQYPLGDGN